VVTAAASIERVRTLLQLRRPADAEREVRGILAQDPQNADAHVYLAVALADQDKGEEALAAAGEAVRLAPGQAFPHYVAGHALRRSGRYQEAVAAFRTALELDPRHAPTWEQLSRAHMGLGEWQPAAGAARRGLEIDPQDSDLVALLAMALIVLGDRDGARAAAADAVRLDPENVLAHLVYGRAALAFGDPRQAADSFREVLRLDPGYGQAMDLLVEALKQRNPVYRWLDRLRERFFGGWRLVLLLPVAPWLVLVFILIAVLHWAAWVAESFTSLRLARAKATKLIFEGAEARVAAVSAGALVLGAALLVLGVAIGHEALATAGPAVMALVTPIQESAHTGSRAGRGVLYGWTLLLVLVIAVSAISAAPAGALLSTYAALATIWIAAGVRRLSGSRYRSLAGA
jgi:tetratricopeptide (TPR) repeat protein